MTSSVGEFEDAELTRRAKRTLRREFNSIGRERVRYKLQAGAYGVAKRQELALQWLSEQEAEDDKIKRKEGAPASSQGSGATRLTTSACKPWL